MMFHEEQSEMDKTFMDLLSRILPKISAKSPGNDCVLDDKADEFKKYFLSVAANKFADAYHSYLFDARVKRSRSGSQSNDQHIKIEIPDSDESENHESADRNLADQVTTITQSNCNESENEPTSSVNSVNTAQSNATVAIILESNEKSKVSKKSSKNGLFFYCPHCHDENSTNKSYNNADEIHKHWVDAHAQSQKIFQFNVGSLFVCNICEKSGTFPELKYHFKIKHYDKQFAMTDPLDVKKCGICRFGGDDLAEHFRLEHHFVSDSTIFSPIRLPKPVFHALKAIDVHKKYQCTVCLEPFPTKEQILDHYAKMLKHDIRKYPYTESSLKQLPYFTCDICDCSMDQPQMIQHFRDHQLKCLICDEFKGKAGELIHHLRKYHQRNASMKNELDFGMKYFQTTIFYDNGLVLNVANLLEPDENEKLIIQSFFQIVEEVRRPIVLETVGSNDRIDGSHSISKNTVHLDYKQKYLEEQWPFQETLIIFGLPKQKHTSDDLMGMFGGLYKRIIGRNLNCSQIKSIYSDGWKVFVRLEKREQRDAILRSPLLKNLNTDDFLKLYPGVKPTPVYVEAKLTKHYLKIAERVRYYIERKLLESYLMRTWGMAVRNKVNGEDVLVNSIDELDSYVDSLVQLKRKHYDASSTSEQRASKQTKY